MHHSPVTADWDTFVFGIPLAAFLFVGYFRLDEIFTSHKSDPVARPRPLPGIDNNYSSMLTDPDGRSWDEPRARKN